MEYLKFFKALYEKKVSYLICGGLAVNIYGIPRMTADIDLLLDFEKVNISNFESVIEAFKYKPLLPLTLNSLTDSSKREELKKEKNLIAFSYYNQHENLMSIDVLIDVPISYSEMWTNRVIRKTDEVEINLVSVEHLIALKEYSNRVQDRQDIIHLKKFKK